MRAGFKPSHETILMAKPAKIEMDPALLKELAHVTRELESIVATLELESDPEAVRSLRRGIADVKAGRVTPWEDFLRKRRRKAHG